MLGSIICFPINRAIYFLNWSLRDRLPIVREADPGVKFGPGASCACPKKTIRLLAMLVRYFSKEAKSVGLLRREIIIFLKAKRC